MLRTNLVSYVLSEKTFCCHTDYRVNADVEAISSVTSCRKNNSTIMQHCKRNSVYHVRTSWSTLPLSEDKRVARKCRIISCQKDKRCATKQSGPECQMKSCHHGHTVPGSEN